MTPALDAWVWLVGAPILLVAALMVGVVVSASVILGCLHLVEWGVRELVEWQQRRAQRDREIAKTAEMVNDSVSRLQAAYLDTRRQLRDEISGE